MSRYLADRIASTPSIDVLPHCEVRELIGDDTLEAVIVEDTETGERRRLERARCSCSSAPSRTRSGCEAASRSTTAATSSPGTMRPRRAAARGRRTARAAQPQLLETSLCRCVRRRATSAAARRQRVAAAVGDGAIAIRRCTSCSAGACEVSSARSDVRLVEVAPAPVIRAVIRLDDRVADDDGRAGGRAFPARSRSSRHGRR